MCWVRRGLGDLIEANGALWAGRMRNADFMAVLKKLDSYMRANEKLVNSAFKNSPRQMLTIGSTGAYDPFLGCYEPDRVREFDQKLLHPNSSHRQLGNGLQVIGLVKRSMLSV